MRAGLWTAWTVRYLAASRLLSHTWLQQQRRVSTQRHARGVSPGAWPLPAAQGAAACGPLPPSSTCAYASSCFMSLHRQSAAWRPVWFVQTGPALLQPRELAPEHCRNACSSGLATGYRAAFSRRARGPRPDVAQGARTRVRAPALQRLDLRAVAGLSQVQLRDALRQRLDLRLQPLHLFLRKLQSAMLDACVPSSPHALGPLTRNTSELRVARHVLQATQASRPDDHEP